MKAIEQYIIAALKQKGWNTVAAKTLAQLKTKEVQIELYNFSITTHTEITTAGTGTALLNTFYKTEFSDEGEILKLIEDIADIVTGTSIDFGLKRIILTGLKKWNVSAGLDSLNENIDNRLYFISFEISIEFV